MRDSNCISDCWCWSVVKRLATRIIRIMQRLVYMRCRRDYVMRELDGLMKIWNVILQCYDATDHNGRNACWMWHYFVRYDILFTMSFFFSFTFFFLTHIATLTFPNLLRAHTCRRTLVSSLIRLIRLISLTPVSPSFRSRRSDLGNDNTRDLLFFLAHASVAARREASPIRVAFAGHATSPARCALVPAKTLVCRALPPTFGSPIWRSVFNNAQRAITKVRRICEIDSCFPVTSSLEYRPRIFSSNINSWKMKSFTDKYWIHQWDFPLFTSLR